MITASIPESQVHASIALSWRQRFARSVLLKGFARIAEGMLHFIDGDQRLSFGTSRPGADLEATVRVLDPRFYGDLVFGGSIAGGETFLNGYWSCDNLTALLRLTLRNARAFDGLDSAWSACFGIFHKASHWLRPNSRRGSRRNISAHYDVGNDFYGLFLDDTWMYSCALFEHPGQSLRDASLAKLERLCRKLKLQPSDHLLEIGSGWGGLALFAAQHFGCRVTTATVSAEQYRFARERIAAANLQDRVEVRLCDYRDLTGTYDKLVSVEMVEAVGERFLETYVRQCDRLLKPGGLFALQSITLQEEHFRRYRRSVDFIQRYIFPGGFLPSRSLLQDLFHARSNLRLSHADDLTAHYAPTLEQWRSAFHANLGAMRALGYTEQFLRMWHYYFCYCEAGFRERRSEVWQLLFEKQS